jgi:hypothetical protein
MNPSNTRENDRDTFRWAAIVAAFLIVGALVFDVFWLKKPPANVDDSPAAGSATQHQRPTSAKPPGS